MPNEILEMDAFHKIASHLANGDALEETLASTVEFAVALVNCDECCTYVRQGEELVPWVWKHVTHGSLDRVTPPVDHGFAAALAAHRAPIVLSNDSANRSTFKGFDEWSPDPGETFICVPFMSRSWLMGAITLHNRRSRTYGAHELKLLSTIGRLLGRN